MVGTSKILTVSYGTFSCTLEGFEDSFSTMKAIAEYFRDLAADDRYFGAEPPTPDAEMLARIAEREIARRVEARTDGTGIVLRAGSALAAPAASPPAAAAAPRQQVHPTPVQAPAARADEAEMAEAMPGSETEAEASALLAVSEPEAQHVAAAAQVVTAKADHEADDAEEDDDGAHLAGDDFDDGYEDGDEDDDEDGYSVQYDRAAGPVVPGDDDEIFAEEVISAAPAAGAAEVTMPPAAQRPAPRQVIVPAAGTGTPGDTETESSMLDAVARATTQASPKAPATPAAPVRRAAAAAPQAPVIPPHPDADSVAAKLQRIRAVVGRAAPAAPAAAPTDIAEEDDSTVTASSLAAIAAVSRGADDASPAEEETRPAFEPALQVTQSAADTAPADVAADAPAETAPAPIRARVIKMRRADFTKAVARGVLQAEDDADETTVARAAAPAAQAPAKTAIGADWDDDDADLGDDDLAALQDEDDLSDADLADALDAQSDASLLAAEEDEADADQDDLARLDGATAATPSDLSAEDEAELMAELAEVEREMGLRDDAHAEPEATPLAFAEADETEDELEETDRADHEDETGPEAYDETDDELHAEVETAGADDAADYDDADDLAAEAEAAREAEADDSADMDEEAADKVPAEAATSLRPRRVLMPQGPDEDEDAVARIMSRADAQLSEPESNRRRDAITQLKAAVAAKEADGSLGKTADTGEIESAFRNDLRQVVKPRRPLTAEARTERPRAAPLKLVASQRVDLPQGAAPAAPKGPVVPVRPRRVTAETPAPVAKPQATGGSFAEFAEEMGAHSLGDLLEAAAAYTAFVEGSEDFSRPQLLNKIKESRDDISREEGLRSFGTLLREGRIMKVRNGRFQVSDETRFHPERRAG